ncbi:MAG TPA: hypothetical protein VJB10_00835 [Candidatus Peribacteraceae bacterium]|nr:hypothetical protein [Candidatus Peribacteraceae bacterium]
MVDSESTALKQFAPTEREFYDEYVGKNTANALDDLEALRPSLTMYPQAYHLTRDAYYELPYAGEGVTEKKPNPKLDALCARRIADIMFSFARRINAVGFKDDSLEAIRFEHVDLSAAHDVSPEAPPPPDDAAIRESFMGGSNVTDRDIAAHGDLGDQRAIDAQLERSQEADSGIAAEVLEEVNAIIEELGGTMRVRAFSDDDATDAGGEGGSGRVQTGTLYSSGSDLGGEICARNCARLLFHAVLNGTPNRPGLSRRLQILTEYGVMAPAEIDLLVQTIQEQVDEF